MIELLTLAQAVATETTVTPEVGMNAMGALELVGAFSCIAFAAIGSAFGCGIAGTAAIACWKKCYLMNKPAPFQLLIFAGAPFSQVIYGMILMFMMLGKCTGDASSAQGIYFLLLGILSGVALGIASYYQGVAGAAASDAQADSGKGFALYLMVLGIVETVSIFAMVFAIVLLSK